MASSMLTAEATALASAEANVNEVLNTKMHSCANDPDFAVICDFLHKFSKDLGLDLPNFKQLLDWLTKTDEVSPQLREMQIKLLRKTRRTVHEKSWESALSKFCFTYSAQDAWELERFGYKNASAKIKLRILRELLESQFERNNKFRAKILTLSADSLRSHPIGRDRLGHAYWVTQDNDCNLRIYQEHLDEEIWQVVATNREEFVNLIKSLRASEVVLPSADIGIVDEDTCSSSHSGSETGQKSPIPKEPEDSPEDEQKVPKLSIKINQGKHSKEGSIKDVGKGEEELAAEEDAKLIKQTLNSASTDYDDEEFEEVEEEYEDESDDDITEEDDEEKLTSLENESKKDSRLQENSTKTVKPLLISQSKIVILAKCDTKVDVPAAKKRTVDQIDANSPTRDDNEQTNAIKKSRPSLLDSKRPNNLSKYEKSNESGEEDYDETAEEEDNVDEEVEEEDIDSVAAEEDENEEKQFDDFEDDDDDNEDEVGEEISESVLHVVGEGSGKECEVGNSFFNYELDENETSVSYAIVEAIFYVRGEGYGEESLVGNNKSESDTPEKSTADTEKNSSLKKEEEKLNLFIREPGCLKLIAIKNDDSKEDIETIQSSENLEHKNTEVSETNQSLENLEPKNTKVSESIKSLEKTKNTTQLDTSAASNEINGENSHKDSKNQTLTKHSNTDTSQSGNIDTIDLPNDDKDKNLSKLQNVSILKPTSNIDCSAIEKIHASKMSVLESLKKELRESKQKSIEKSVSSKGESNKSNLSSSVVLNRKRRIDNLTAQQNTSMRSSNSESEVDHNSEHQEDLPTDQKHDIDELDIGGKRFKMRAKQTNSELRKKIEAQKVAANEDNTSSSGGEEESRRKKKVIGKKHTDQTFNLEETEKPVESTKNVECSSKIDEKDTMCADATISPSSVGILTENTLDENKHKLTKITQKNVKKTSEKDETECVSPSSVETGNVQSNRSPITKPLKKIIVRKYGSDEDAVAPKQLASDNSISAESTVSKVPDDKETIQNNGDNPQNSPERQRKRRSSEDTIKNEAPEEPEAKKEVNCEHSRDNVTKADTNIIVKKEKDEDEKEKEVDIKEESTSEYISPAAGRRSGRRGGLTTPANVKNSQPKRARGLTKNTTKKPIQNISTSVEDDKDIKGENMPSEVKQQKIEEDNDTKTNDSEKKATETELNKSKIPKSITSPVKYNRKQRDVDATNILEVIDNEAPVRQSRRIAQQKIREEAERRKLEEIALRTMKQELKKKKKAEKQVDPTVVPPTEPSSESEESDVETKRKVQKKKCPGKNGSWSSGSEEQEEPDEEDEEPPHYDPGSPLFKSDHEFSPESDIEDESQVVPMKRARTVRKEDAADDEPDEEEACQKCNKSDHPEWILLCDNCDKGYHCSCLSPVLFYIPEGDWYCPPCQQEQLIKALESHLKEFDDLVECKRNEEEKEKILAEEEKARLEEEIRNTKHKNQKKTKTHNDDSSDKDVSHSSRDDGDSDESVNSKRRKSCAKNKKTNRFRNSKNSDKRNDRDRRQNARNVRNRAHKRGSDSDSDSRFNSKRASKSNSTSTSSSSSSSYSESDNEPIYKLRKRRQINVSYRLNEYDDLINSALKKEMDEAAGAGNLGRGKDISTIIEADKEEKARQKNLDDGEPATEELSKSKSEEDNGKEIKEDVVELDLKESEANRESNDDDSDDEPIKQKFNIKPSLKKKSRKLTTLDISSEDDHGSDEDFKGSSLDDDDEDTSISASNSDSSLEIYKRQGKSRKKRRKAARRAFRERRKDRKFVVDESDDEEVQRPKSKKKRKDDSDYTESEADDDDNSELSENIDSADLCDDTTSDESDGAWRPNKSKKAKKSSMPFVQKSPKPKKLEPKKPKKIEYSDDDVSESEEDENDEESGGGGGGGKEMGGKQPRSQPLKTSSTATKTKLKGKGGTSTKIKKKKKSSEDELSESDSEDSTRRTRGRRYAYMEDFDDDSSDGGIKPGVQRPDTPPEEREKFIKRQEEIKRMLAEKNAEGAKLVATPRLTPIKTDSEKEKRSPVKAGGDSLSTVPLSVIRQAKVLDIDYLQRRGEPLDDLSTDVGEVDDDFDDADLPDDLPEDMDEDTIARMVEEEEEFGAAAARELPPPDEVLRAPLLIKPKPKDVDKPVVCSNAASFPSHTSQTSATLPPSSGLQEPIRKRLPMPTMHPPLLRHQFLYHDPIASAQHLMQRHSGPPTTSHLLQSALSAPLTQPLDRNYPSGSSSQSHHSLINRMTHSIPLQPTAPHVIGAPRPSISNTSKSTALIEHSGQEKSNNTRTETEMKPRGRRKKITPLRDTLQKQQAAAAVTAATATNSILASTSANQASESVSASVFASVIKSGPTTKGHMETSVITSVPPAMPPVSSRPIVTMPSVSGTYSRSDGPRFYDSMANRPVLHRHRGPPQMPHSLLQPHPAIRSSYGPPPPLKGSNSVAANSPTSSGPGSIRPSLHHVPPYVGMPPNTRHSSPHLNMYRQPIYGNPSFGPRVNLRPNMHAPEYSTGSRTYSPYGFYPPPPPLTTPGQGPVSSLMSKIQQPISQPSTSVIVSATAAASSKSAIIPPGPPPSSVLCEHSSKSSTITPVLSIKVGPSKSPSHLPQSSKVVAEPRKKLTTLQSYGATSPAKKSPLPPTAGESSGSLNSPGIQSEAIDDSSSTPGLPDNSLKTEPTRIEGHASEFSGLVSYFSSQHDDYNT